MPKRFRDFVGVSVKEDEADGDPVSGVVLLGISCAADSSYKQMTESLIGKKHGMIGDEYIS